MNIKKTKASHVDMLGVVSSAICLAHCNFSILFFAFGFNYSLGSENDHWIDLLFLFSSFCAVFHSMNLSQSAIIPWCMLGAFILLAFGVIFHEDFKWSHYVSGVGSVALIIIHVWNMKYCSWCKREDDV